MPQRATLEMEGGPLDGVEIVWPPYAGDFPSHIRFGYYANDENDKIRDPQTVTHHQYAAYHGWQHGPLDPDDGMPESEVQCYMYEDAEHEKVPSVADMWNNPD